MHIFSKLTVCCVTAAASLSVGLAQEGNETPNDWFQQEGYEYDSKFDLDFDVQREAESNLESRERTHDSQFDYMKEGFREPRTLEEARKMDREMQARREMNRSSEAAERPARYSAAGERLVSGYIRNVDVVRMMNPLRDEDEHTVVLLTLGDGSSTLVDLGSTRQHPDFDLSEGDAIVVHGRMGRINNRAVVFAREATVNGETYRIDPRLSGRSDRNGMIRGTVLGYSWILLEEDGEETEVLRLRFSDGDTRLVDLGSEDASKRLELEKNDLVTVRGRPDYVDGQPVIRAGRITVNGKSAFVRR